MTTVAPNPRIISIKQSLIVIVPMVQIYKKISATVRAYANVSFLQVPSFRQRRFPKPHHPAYSARETLLSNYTQHIFSSAAVSAQLNFATRQKNATFALAFDESCRKQKTNELTTSITIISRRPKNPAKFFWR